MTKLVYATGFLLCVLLPSLATGASIVDFSTTLVDDSRTWEDFGGGPDNTTAEITLAETTGQAFEFEFLGDGHSWAAEAPFTNDFDILDVTYTLVFTIAAAADEEWSLSLTSSTLMAANVLPQIEEVFLSNYAFFNAPSASAEGDVSIEGEILPPQGGLSSVRQANGGTINNRELESFATVSGLGPQVFALTYMVDGETYSYDDIDRIGDYTLIVFEHRLTGELTQSGPSAVPEPSTLGLLCVGLLGFGLSLGRASAARPREQPRARLTAMDR